jgi:hypothetical protein
MARQEILDKMVASIPQFNLLISPGTQLRVVSFTTKYFNPVTFKALITHLCYHFFLHFVLKTYTHTHLSFLSTYF